MNTEGIREAVHRFISRLLEGREDFADNASLSQLGLDKQDIEELIFYLEDELKLTAFTHEEDQLLKSATTAEDLIRFLEQIGQQ
ncbi:hypothetical protein D3C72_1656250 [compost metagenome]